MQQPVPAALLQVSVQSLKKRADFLRLNRQGTKFVTSTMIILTSPRPAPEGMAAVTENFLRIGYTVTKKIGNAVIRNRIKRRLREAVRIVLPVHGKPGHDYVLIARHAALKAEFSILTRDLQFALTRLSRPRPPEAAPHA